MAATTPAEGESVRCCPECDSAQVWQRTWKKPTYRCTHGHEFEEAASRPERKTGRQRIPDADLLGDVRRVADDVGGIPTIAAYREHGSYAYQTLYRRFGGWANVLKSAGVRGGDAA